MIGVRQFVEDDPRHAVVFKRREKILRVRNVNALRERLAVAVFLQPVGARVILHRAEFAVVEVEYDDDRLKFLELLGRHNGFDIA